MSSKFPPFTKEAKESCEDDLEELEYLVVLVTEAIIDLTEDVSVDTRENISSNIDELIERAQCIRSKFTND